MPPLSDTTAIVRDLFSQYGLVALFAVFVIEGVMLLYFAPSESLVPAAIVLLGNSYLDYAYIIAIAVVGATVGQTILFVVSKRAGRKYLIEKRWIPVKDAWIDRFEGWFERWGIVAVPISNTLPFTRGMLTVPAGLADKRVGTFVVASAVGTLVFETILAGLTLGVINVL